MTRLDTDGRRKPSDTAMILRGVAGRDPSARSLILIAEDDPHAEELALRALAADDLELVTATSGEEALELYTKLRPDAVLLNVRMPDRDGFDICARIRAMAGGESVPVLMVTALEDLEAVDRAYECGATDFVTKPITYALLGHRVRYLLRASRAFRDAREAAGSLTRAQNLARLEEWELDPVSRVFRWSTVSQEIFGGLGGEGHVRYVLLRWVHFSDRARVEDALAAPGTNHVEYRLVLPSGEERIIHQLSETRADPITGKVRIIGTAQDVTALRTAERQVAQLASFDALTGLPNRAHACRFLDSAIDKARIDGGTVAILSLDLDLFRRVNDCLGRPAGDALLQEVAGRISSVVEASGTVANRACLAARMGGDEFVVIVPGVASPAQASELFRLIAARISEPCLLDGSDIVMSCGGGIATFPANGQSVDVLLRNADAAMHAAKERGRGCLEIYAAAIEARAERSLVVERRLRAALTSGTGLELHYQPKVELPSGKVGGVEALLRCSPVAGVGPISPMELVAVAEQTGLIVDLGDWVLRTSCLQAREWAENGPCPVRVAVNIAARQFAEPDFATKVANVLAETKLSPSLLDLEITESVMMVDTTVTGRTLDALKRLGVSISLDDFGTGYSSLAYLTRFPIDTLKIDRSFIKDLGITQKSDTIVGAIIALARSLDIAVVAEGVETQSQCAFLERFGSLEIQGWLFAKAMPASAAAAWIMARQALELPLPKLLATG